MSRLDTQGDRLVRGPGSFEQQISFLVQPQRFAAGNGNNVSQIVAGIAQVAGQVTGIKEQARVKRDRVDAEKDLTIYNQVLEARNKAEGDPEKYGPEFARMYDYALSNVNTPEAKTQILRLDGDNTLDQYYANQRAKDDSVALASMSNAFIEFDATYDPIDTEYITLNDTERYDRIYNETLSDLEAVDPNIVSRINEDEEFRNVFMKSVKAINNKYAALSSQHIANQTNERNNRMRQGTIQQLLSSPDPLAFFDSFAQGLSSATLNTLDAERQNLLNGALQSMQVDLTRGATDMPETLRLLSKMQTVADTMGTDGQAAILAAKNKILSEYAQETGRMIFRTQRESLGEGLAPSEVRAELNNLALAQWENATGLEAPADADISSFDAGVGINLDLAQALNDQYQVSNRELAALENQIASASKVNASSGYETAREGQALFQIRGGNVSGVRQSLINKGYNPADIPDGLLSYQAGQVDAVSLAQYSNQDRLAQDIHSAFISDGVEGRKWAIGGLLAYNDATFRSTLRGMDPKATHAMIALREFASGQPVEEIFTSGTPEQIDEFFQEARAAYDSGTRDAEALGEVGSTPIDSKLQEQATTQVRNKFNIPDDAPLGSSLTNAIALSSSRIISTDVDMSEAEKAKAVRDHLTADGYTIYRDGLSGQWEAIKDDSKSHPLSRGVSAEALDYALTTDFGIARGARVGNDPVTDLFAFTGSNLGIIGGTPLLSASIAAYAQVSVDNPDELSDVVGVLVSRELANIETGFLPEGYAKKFKDGDLKLSVAMLGGKPMLVATGIINDIPYAGDDAIVLTDWVPSWSNAVETTREDLVFPMKAAETVANVASFVVGASKLSASALEEREAARASNPSAFRIRP